MKRVLMALVLCGVLSGCSKSYYAMHNYSSEGSNFYPSAGSNDYSEMGFRRWSNKMNPLREMGNIDIKPSIDLP